MPTVKDELLQRDVEAFFAARADLIAGAADLTPAGLSDALIGFVKALRASGESVSDARFDSVLSQYAAVLKAQRVAVKELDGVRYNGVLLRAAIHAGILTELDEDGVGAMRPGAVTALARKIDRAIGQSLEVPGE